MKSSYTALAVVGLALAGLWYAGGGAAVPPQSAAAAESPRVSAPLSHDNLTVYFVHGPDAVANVRVATLQEALDAGWAVVHETGTVNTLAVENLSSDTELFMQEGDIVKGGRQDRMVAADMLVSPKSVRVPFPAHCVEQGRWTGRGKESAAKFARCDNFAVGNPLKLANASGNQGQVWDNVKKNQEQLSAKVGVKVNATESETSLQLALENEAVVAKVNEFDQALRSAGEADGNVIGVVFVRNGQVMGAEVYGSNALFRKAWPKLLRAAATEAVAEKTDRPSASPPTAGEVERFLALAGRESAAGTSGRGGRNPNGPDTDLINEDIGLAAIDNIELGARGTAFRGRSGSTRSVLASGGGNARAANPTAVNPTANVQDNVILGGNALGRVDEQRLRQLTETWSGQGPQQRARTVEELTRDMTPQQRAQVEEYFRVLASNPNTAASVSGSQAPNPAPGNALQGLASNEFNAWTVGHRVDIPVGNANPPAANPNPGNRLTVNRVEDRAGLVSESRDPGRGNAVLHRSFIKK